MGFLKNIFSPEIFSPKKRREVMTGKGNIPEGGVENYQLKLENLKNKLKEEKPEVLEKFKEIEGKVEAEVLEGENVWEAKYKALKKIENELETFKSVAA